MIQQLNKSQAEFIVKQLGVSEYRATNNKITMSCPIHGGDNASACVIYFDGKGFSVNWKCYTHHCEQEIGKSLNAFVAGVLNCDKLSAVKWLESNCGIKQQKADPHYTDPNFEFSSQIKNFTRHSPPSINLSLTEFKKYVIIPCPYFIRRGFKKETLETFYVGLCNDRYHYMYNRSIVPIFDKNGEYIIGYSGRSIYDKCILCDLYHDNNRPCPVTNMEEVLCQKWINSKGFSSEAFFYNYWNSTEEIKRRDSTILVEGKPDTWRVYESGYKNVLGQFGSVLKNEQQKTLEKLGCTNLITMFDPDESGESCRKDINNRLSRFFNIHHIVLDKDPGDTPIEVIQENIEKLNIHALV